VETAPPMPATRCRRPFMWIWSVDYASCRSPYWCRPLSPAETGIGVQERLWRPSGGDGGVWVDFGIWAEAEKNLRSGIMTHGTAAAEIEAAAKRGRERAGHSAQHL